MITDKNGMANYDSPNKDLQAYYWVLNNPIDWNDIENLDNHRQDNNEDQLAIRNWIVYHDLRGTVHFQQGHDDKWELNELD